MYVLIISKGIKIGKLWNTVLKLIQPRLLIFFLIKIKMPFALMQLSYEMFSISNDVMFVIL